LRKRGNINAKAFFIKIALRGEKNGIMPAIKRIPVIRGQYKKFI